MHTLGLALIVLAVGAANSALFIWLARRAERRIISAVQVAGASAVAAIQTRCADLQAAGEVIGQGIMSAVQLKSEYLYSAVDALRADVCTKAPAGMASGAPAVLIPEQHCLDIELKAALAAHGIATADLLNRTIADAKVLYDVLEGRGSAGLLMQVLQAQSSPLVAKQIFSEIAHVVDGARAAAGVAVSGERLQ
ncbi:MAG: hypothetical protein WAO35_13400 [Terriglobia bacterium]